VRFAFVALATAGVTVLLFPEQLMNMDVDTTQDKTQTGQSNRGDSKVIVDGLERVNDSDCTLLAGAWTRGATQGRPAGLARRDPAAWEAAIINSFKARQAADAQERKVLSHKLARKLTELGNIQAFVPVSLIWRSRLFMTRADARRPTAAGARESPEGRGAGSAAATKQRASGKRTETKTAKPSREKREKNSTYPHESAETVRNVKVR
jgi:hypothetical protein